MSHLEFSLKYDDLNLDFLKTVLGKIPVAEITAFIEAAPSGKYARMIGFLYEFLTQKMVALGIAFGTMQGADVQPVKYVGGAKVLMVG